MIISIQENLSTKFWLLLIEMKVLIIGKVWPESKSSAAGRRMNQLIQLFSTDADVTFATASKKTGYEDSFENASFHKIVVNDDDFDGWVKSLNPAIVIFDRFMIEEQFGWRVAENCPSAMRILNTEDLHFLRKAREKAVKSGKSYLDADLLNEETYRELASMYRVDLNLMVSNFEIDLLVNHFKFPEQNLFYLPIFSNMNCETSAFNDKQDFVFIGNYLHEPNWDALRLLKTEIWPKIREALPSAKLHVYGAYAGQKVMDLANETEGFFVHGRAEYAEVVIKNARVMLAPLRFGAGMKGKLLEAMENATPSVTTSCGIESMASALEWNGFVSDNWEVFAKNAVQLYSDQSTWESAVEKGKSILKNYDKKNFEVAFQNKIKSISEHLFELRNENIVGSIIQQQSLLSTKYLSRWIIEKNKYI